MVGGGGVLLSPDEIIEFTLGELEMILTISLKLLHFGKDSIKFWLWKLKRLLFLEIPG